VTGSANEQARSRDSDHGGGRRHLCRLVVPLALAGVMTNEGELTRQEFLQALRDLRMTQGKFAEHAGVSPTAVYHWGGSSGRFPKWVGMLLAAWQSNRDIEAQLIKAQLDLSETTLQPLPADIPARRKGD
jgi:hypothetical protein